MDLLARREHSCFELRCKLLTRGFEEPLIEEVIRVLADEGLLSDSRFAEAYINMRANRGFGPLRIQAELCERGVSDDVIEQLLDFESEQWLGKVITVKEKKFGVNQPKDYLDRGKQAKFLQYRGYSSAQIKHVLSL